MALSACAWSHLVWAALGLASAFWCVSLVALSAQQSLCRSNAFLAPFMLSPVFNTAGLSGVDGFSATVSPCSAVFAKTWTTVALGFLALAVASLAAAAGCAPRARPAFCGLFAVVASLYVEQAHQWVAAGHVHSYRRGTPAAPLLGAMCAGMAGSAASFLLLILAFGCDAAPPPPPPPAGSPRRAAAACPFASSFGAKEVVCPTHDGTSAA